MRQYAMRDELLAEWYERHWGHVPTYFLADFRLALASIDIHMSFLTILAAYGKLSMASRSL